MKICDIVPGVELHKTTGNAAYHLVFNGGQSGIVIPDCVENYPLTEALALLESLAQFYLTWRAATPEHQRPDLLKAMHFEIVERMKGTHKPACNCAH